MIFSIGEALIDKKGDKEFIGGCPLNVAWTAAVLNVASSFIGGISSDDNGRKILKHIIDNCIIFDSGFCSRPEHTMIAGVTLKDGKEEYVFDYKNSSAFFMDPGVLEGVFRENTDINAIFYGSVTFTNPSSARVILDFIKNHNDIVSVFDPNIRLKAVEDLQSYKINLEEACRISDIVKVSDDDLKLWGKTADQVYSICKHHLIVTEGAKGSTWYSKDLNKPVHVDAFAVPENELVDTIGCGDCFTGALLYCLDNRNFLKGNSLILSEVEILDIMFLCSAYASANARREGCHPVPLEDIK